MLRCDRWVRLEHGKVITVYRSEGYGRRWGAVECGGELVVDVGCYDRERGDCDRCYREYVSVRCVRCSYEHGIYDTESCVELVARSLGL